MTRKDILDAALKCVNGDRDHQYGSPENNFAIIAKFWNAYLGGKTYPGPLIEPMDVAAMLALLKIARVSTGQVKDDNWIDLAGYAACGGEIVSGKSKGRCCGEADYCEIDMDDDIAMGNTIPRKFE